MDGTLIVWDLATGAARHRLRGHERRVRGCAVSGDGRTGLSASSDRMLIVWDLATGERRCRLSLGEGLTAVGCRADGGVALAVHRIGNLSVFDVAHP
jgi:WD40 repeat protein